MSLGKIFDVAGSGMNAQSLRLNITASNISNAGSTSGDPEKVYRARQPIFGGFDASMENTADQRAVRVLGVVESQAPLQMLYQPAHPEADESGHVFVSNVNAIEEMVNMMSASRAYQSNVEVLQTTKELMLQTLSLGQ